MTSKERKKLREQSHGLKPAVMIGKSGLTAEVIKAADSALASSELVKIRFTGFKEQRRELSEKLSGETSAEIVDIIGNVLILYRKYEDE